MTVCEVPTGLANLEGMNEMATHSANAPKNTISEVPFSRSSGIFNHGNNVDIEGVTGSIPVTPTILFNHLADVCIVPFRFNEPARKL